MSDKKNRLAEQSKEDRLDQNGALPESDIGNTSAHGKEEDLPSPTELLNDLLAGLEGGMHSSEQVVQQPAPATAEQSGDQPVLDAVEADTDNQAEEQMPGQAEIIEETDESEPVAEHISTAPEAEADESEFEADDAEENAAIKPVTETALTVSPNGTNGTEGMTLMERAQYHARMRRREQTRLRRESAKRGASGAEIPYQAMTPMDMRFTLIRLAIAAIFLIFGVFLRQTAIGFIFYLIAYLITVLPIVVKVAHNFTHGKYFDEYLLIFIASLGAFLLGNRPEASVVLILHGVGKIASDLVLASTHKSLTKQTGFIPEHASVVNMQGEERQVSPNEIKIGDFVLVRSGERDTLVMERDSLNAQLAGHTTQLTAPATGYFSEVVDGYEGILTLDELEDITVDRFHDLTETKPIVSEQAWGKMIQGFTWYLVAEISQEDADRFSVGQSLHVNFTQASLETPVSVYSVIKDRTSETALVVLAGTEFNSEMVSMRQQPIEIIIATYTGLKVPKEAVYVQETTTSDGKTQKEDGVFILSGSFQKFKIINKLYETEDYYVVEQSATNSDMLVAQDQIIISGKNLQNNMVVKT